MPTVISVNISNGGIPKLPVERCEVTMNGLKGDGRDHDKHCCVDRAVSLIDVEILNQLAREGYPVYPGAVGENLTVQHLNLQSCQAGDQLHFDGGLCIELVEARKPCFVLDPLGETLKKDIVGRCGFLARVLRKSTIKPGAKIVLKQVKAS